MKTFWLIVLAYFAGMLVGQLVPRKQKEICLWVSASKNHVQIQRLAEDPYHYPPKTPTLFRREIKENEAFGTKVYIKP